MFDREYIIKIYLGGQGVPLLEFRVVAQSVQIEGHSIKIDGVTLNFSEHHYIAVETA
jgi:hypothetical protein